MKCPKCGDDFEPRPYELRNQFYRCQACRKTYDIAWRAKRKAQGLRAGGTKTWDPEKKAVWLSNRKKDAKAMARKAEQMKQYRADPVKRARFEARQAVRRQLVAGKLHNEPCAFCGAIYAEKHHPDYSQPLLIVWLCRECHRGVHAKAEGRA
jgi:hypothetical protein